MIRRLLPIAMALVTCLAACAHSSPARRPMQPVPADGDSYLAGVALADITPPLHLSLFGHGPESRIATGVRLRLRCEVFVVASAGNVVALIPCDLQSPSMALQRRIAELLERVGVPISADRIFLMATHTHAAPAHYFESRRYSGPFSSYAPGFDPEVVEFLAGRISAAAVEAFASMAPACIGSGTTELAGLTFNRSYVPFLANRDTASGDRNPLKDAQKADQTARPGQNALAPAGGSQGQFRATGPEEAVDRKLTVVRIDRRTGASCDASQPIGVFAVFGMHPTGIPNTNELYHGDIFGFAVRAAEDCLRSAMATPGRAQDSSRLPVEEGDPRACEAKGPAPERGLVVGLANGVEGDVSPKIDFQSVLEARRLGRTLGWEIAKLAARVPAMKPAGRIERAYWELSFPGGRFGATGDERICETPELGMSAAGGARDGPTRLRVIPEANAGFRLVRPSGCQAEKLPLRMGLSPSEYDFPLVAPIGLIRIGEAVLATTPGEMTTMTGQRARQAIRQRLGASDASVAIIGLTNQYMQYFATEEEYGFQYYEGASTLYGPNSSRFLARHFACLADVLSGRPETCGSQPSVNTVGRFQPSPSPVVSRMPTEEEVQLLLVKAVIVQGKSRDGAYGWEADFERMPLTFTGDRGKFSVEVLAGETGSQVVDDDRGSSIEVREIADGQRWRVRWIPDLALGQTCEECDRRCGGTYRIAVRGRFRFESRPFTLDPCARSCGK